MAASEMDRQALERELRQTEPDYVVYAPHRDGGDMTNTGNEHFLVFDGPDGSLLALWTQSTHEGAGDHHLVMARSDDDGHTWTVPWPVVGPRFVGDGPMASWGFPLVSASGRIYAVWNQYRGVDDVHFQFTGTMDAAWSDDLGKTWSAPQTVPMPRTIHDHPDPEVPSNWIVWQLPRPDRRSGPFTGFTRWVSPAVRTPPHRDSWTAWESVV